MSDFELQNKEMVAKMAADAALGKSAKTLFDAANLYQYSYHFTWLGRPIIQYPQDMVAVQEIIWRTKPDLIIETGVAHGGSLILSASILELIGGEGEVLGIDVDIRAHNRSSIEEHPMFRRISLIEGSSVSEEVMSLVRKRAEGKKRILVLLDSNHTHAHVKQELELYSPLVTKDSYLVVFDTVIEDMPSATWENRSWGHGNNPKTAVWEFLKENNRFEIDRELEGKLLLTVAPDGYLKCLAD